MSQQKQRGFTLLEMMLALAIFALISLAGYQIMQTILRNQQQTEQHSQQLGSIVRLFSLLENDLQHALIPLFMVTTPPSDDAPFKAGNGPVVLELTRRNWVNPLALPRSSLQRAQWRFEQKTLTRINLSNQEITGVFPQISAVQLRYFSANRWQNRWTAHYALPQAIEVTVTTASWGPVTRIFMLTAEQP